MFHARHPRKRHRLGEQAACQLCDQDIEYHGRRVGWIDRGGGKECLVYYDRKLHEYVEPPEGQKHEPYEG